jgi:hypothetical protein
VRAAQEKLQSRLGTKVLITANTRGAGKLELHFSSQDELSRLFDGLMTAKF